MIEAMIKAFLIFTILFLPVISIYSNGGAYSKNTFDGKNLTDKTDAEKDEFSLSKLSLGNLGHYEAICL